MRWSVGTAGTDSRDRGCGIHLERDVVVADDVAAAGLLVSHWECVAWGYCYKKYTSWVVGELGRCYRFALPVGL